MSRKKRIGRIALTVALLLVAQEVLFRVCFPIPELNNFDRINYMMLATEYGQFRHQRNQSWYWQSTPDTAGRFVHEMNQYGFRDDEWPVAKEIGTKRFLFIGDSFVEGVMAHQGQTIPDGFEDALGSEDVEVFNGGMMGTGLSSYLMLLSDAVPVFKPDYVFFCISTNDLTQIPPTVPQGRITPKYFSVVKPRIVELISQWTDESPIQFQFGIDPKPYMKGVESNSNPWALNESSLTPHVEPFIAEAMKKGEFSPFRVNNLAAEANAVSLRPELGETLQFLSFVCKEYGVTPYVVYLPSRNIVTTHYYQYERTFCKHNCPDSLDLTLPAYQTHQQFLAQQCAQQGIQFLNTYQFLRLQEESGNRMYWNFDDHMRGSAYRQIGAGLADAWQQLQ